MAQNKRPAVFIPLLITLALTLAALAFNFDIRISNLFFHIETGTWLFKNTPVEKLVYDLSPIPAFILFGIGVIVALGSIWKKTWRRWIRVAVFWVLLMVLGPGLVVNAVFKDYYGRPRPKQICEYGGPMTFKPVWVPGTPGKGKSFPCGHASIGFYFLGGYFCWWRSNRRRARRWLAGGLIAGCAIGLARIAVGAHWFSDVIWAGTFTYFISYLLAAVCGLLKAPAKCEENP
jgi:membrane-associated PAP2 superfamily phosphatase